MLVCNQIKAVHLEVVVGLETQDFLNAMERFTAIRGPVEKLFSDNGSTFLRARGIIGADDGRAHEGGQAEGKGDANHVRGGSEDSEDDEDEEEMATIIRGFDEPEVRAEAAKLGIKHWRLSAAYDAPGNGTAEAFVKLAKKNLHRTFKHADMTLDQLQTAAKMSENTINNRPIGKNKCPPEAMPTIITPNHLIIGRLGSTFAPWISTEEAGTVADRWAKAKKLHATFTDKWRQDIIPLLHKREKWSAAHENVAVGQVVLMIDFSEKRSEWPLAVITHTIPDDKGVVRRVRLRAKMDQRGSAKQYERCIRQIVPLDVICT